MIPALLVGTLCSLAALAIVLPLWNWHGSRELVVVEPELDQRRELLKQLRDLDDDLAHGKISDSDHRRLREPVELAAAAALAESDRIVRKARPLPARPARTAAPARSRRSAVARWTIGLAVIAIGAAGAWSLLVDAVDPRPGTLTQASAEASAAAPGADAPPTTGTNGQSAVAAPTDEQIAQVRAAVARVTSKPRDAVAHLELARAYAEAGQRQLSTIEYLAVTQLEPGHPEAGTALALVAFTAGEVVQARELVDQVLRVHPRHPEALYARGVIKLMGLNRPEQSRRDLEAYLAAAPYGSHREAVDTLLQIIGGGTAK
jgi:hypothetical protein